MSSSFSQLVAVLNSIVLVPLYLHAWGANGYGQWLALTALVSYISLLDFGTQSYIGNLLGAAYIRNDSVGFRQILANGMGSSLCTIICVFISIAIVLATPSGHGFGLIDDLQSGTRLTILLLVVSSLITIPAGVYATAYRATGEYARGAFVGNIANLFALGISVFSLFLHINLLHYSILLLVHTIIRTGVVSSDIHRRIPWSSGLPWSWFGVREGYKYWRESSLFWIAGVGTTINSQGVLLILASTQPIAAIAVLSTHRTAANLLRYPGATLQAPLWPELTFLWGQAKYDTIGSWICRTTALVMFITSMLAVFLILLLPSVYPVWTGKALNFDPALLIILLIQAVLASAWSTLSWGLLAANQHHEFAFYSLLNGLLTIGAAIWLAKPYGVTGVAIASLVVDATLYLLAIPLLNRKRLRIPLAQQYKAVGGAFALVAPIIALSVIVLPRADTPIVAFAFVALSSLYALIVILRQIGWINWRRTDYHI